MDHVKKLKISFEYGTSPVWVSVNNGFFDNYDPHDKALGFSDEIIAGIMKLDSLFQATFNEAYPPDSGFPTGTMKAQFEKQVSVLKEKIAKELNGNFQLGN